MDCREKVEKGFYNCNLDYPSRDLKKKVPCPICGQSMVNKDGEEEYKRLLKEYNDKNSELMGLFYKDAMEYVGLSNHPKADKIFNKAWESGHAYGHSEVLSKLEDLAELFT